MADISKITLPSGESYNIKDAVAREAVSAGLQIVVVKKSQTWPDASASTMGKLYLREEDGQQSGTYVEYVTIDNGEGVTVRYAWEKIGTTSVDLSEYAQKGDTVTVTLNNNVSGTGVSAHSITDNGHIHSFSGTANPSSVTFDGGTTDEVLGTGTGFSVSLGTSTKRIKATASGTAVEGNGTAAAITGFGAHSTDTFAKSVTADVSKKLVTTTVTGVSGSTTASKATAGTPINVAQAGTAVQVGDGTVTTSTTNEDILKNISVTGEILSFGACTLDKTSVVPAVSNGTITPYTFNNVTVPKAATAATTVATGTVNTTGTGSAVATGVSVSSSAAAITGLGTPTTADALTGVKVKTQPTITLADGSGTDYGINIPNTSGTATADTTDVVTVVKTLGTATAAGQTFSGTTGNSAANITIGNHTVTQGKVTGSATGTISE